MNAQVIQLAERWQAQLANVLANLALDDRVLVLALALLAAATVYTATRTWRISLGKSPERLLADYYARQKEETRSHSLHVDRDSIILMSLGLPPEGRYLTAIRAGAAGLLFLAMALAGYPILLSLALGGVAYMLVNGLLDNHWQAFRMSVERDLPLVAARLSGVLQITSSPLQALDNVIETLPENRPVRVFLEEVRREANVRGPRAFAEAKEAAERISPSLATMMLLLGRLSETGGATYARAFLSVADELFTIARVRAIAGSKAHSARLNLYIILAAMVFGTIFFLRTPTLLAALDDPFVQVVQVAAVAMLVFGVRLINDMIQRSMEV